MRDLYRDISYKIRTIYNKIKRALGLRYTLYSEPTGLPTSVKFRIRHKEKGEG